MLLPRLYPLNQAQLPEQMPCDAPNGFGAANIGPAGCNLARTGGDTLGHAYIRGGFRVMTCCSGRSLSSWDRWRGHFGIGAAFHGTGATCGVDGADPSTAREHLAFTNSERRETSRREFGTLALLANATVVATATVTITITVFPIHPLI